MYNYVDKGRYATKGRNVARAPVTTTDETAQGLIAAALELLDEGLGHIDDLDPARWAKKQNSSLPPLFARLTAAAVCTRAGTSYTRAITSRWGDIHLFVHDVLRAGCATAHSDGTTWAHLATMSSEAIRAHVESGTDVIEACITAVDDLMSYVASSPRALLPAHMAPYFPGLGPLGLELSICLHTSQQTWAVAVGEALTSGGYRFRAGWSAESVVGSVQALLDGWLVRRWTMPHLVTTRPLGAPERSDFARTVEALALGVIA